MKLAKRFNFWASINCSGGACARGGRNTIVKILGVLCGFSDSEVNVDLHLCNFLVPQVHFFVGLFEFLHFKHGFAVIVC
jgi:hypothetical protein